MAEAPDIVDRNGPRGPFPLHLRRLFAAGDASWQRRGSVGRGLI